MHFTAVYFTTVYSFFSCEADYTQISQVCKVTLCYGIFFFNNKNHNVTATTVEKTSRSTFLKSILKLLKTSVLFP